MTRFYLGAAAAMVIAAAPIQTGAGNLSRGCVDQFDAARDYFPDKVTVRDAANFSVEYRRSFKVVTVRGAYGGSPPERYVLVQCGTPAPALSGDLAGAQVVQVPATSVFAGSTTQVMPLVDLKRLEVLAGVSRLRDLAGDAVKSRTASGAVREFAAAGVVDAELVVASRPTVFMSAGGDPALSAVRSAGIPVVANTEWLEPTALARAEWLKYIALFVNEERQATALHDATTSRYRALSARALAVPEASRPLVMTGRSTRGTWVIAGGRSYVAALIHDAGGRYVWADNTAVGAPNIDLEAVIRRAANADIWINGGGWPTMAAMLDDEPRYAEFKAYKSGQVWVYERRQTSGGGNDYWSRSVSHPDLVLADLVKIFHPSLMPDHMFEWYMTVRPR